MWTYNKIYNTPFIHNGASFSFDPTLNVPVPKDHDDYGKTLQEVLNLTEEQVTQIIQEAKWTQIREYRDAELKASDWTQGADVPSSIKDMWSVYRNALRNLPQEFTNPDDVVFPEKP
jgi:Phage tail assembly chaperone protein